MVDSRTVLDAPGAEDLIGRGDMLYQPVDLPRPGPHAGRVRRATARSARSPSTGSTRPTAGRSTTRTSSRSPTPRTADGGDGGQFAWLRKFGVDEMTVPAAELVTTSQRASTSMLQTKLKLGFARASRVMDELERYGIIGPQDPRNPATPRQIYGPRQLVPLTQDDIDDPGD